MQQKKLLPEDDPKVSVRTLLRLRPLEPKHKLKDDYFSIKSQAGLQQRQNTFNKDGTVSVGSEASETLSSGRGPHDLGDQGQVITIHDPLKRSKDQYDFKLDRIYTADKSNAAVAWDQLPNVDRVVKNAENQLIISFGHKDSGKTYTVMGENNYQLEKNLSDVEIHQSDDSRGLVMRYAHAIRAKDPTARLGVSFVDLVMDNVRDLLKYVRKDQRKNQNSNSTFGGLDEPSVTKYGGANENSDYVISQAQSVEKDFLEMHERPGFRGQSIYYLKNLTLLDNIHSLSELAYYLDKGAALSEQLNKKLNYTPGLRAIQVFQLAVRSKNGKDIQLIFVDLPNYEKLQTNIIDNQKLYESIVINNTFNSLASLVSGFNNNRFPFSQAPFENSKLTRIIQSILQQSHPSSNLSISFFCCLWPTESRYMEVVDTLKFLDKIARADQLMGKSVYQGEMSTNQEKIMQEISKENVEIKFKIDAFKREHAHKLKELQSKLGLDIPMDAVLKSKGNQKELQVIKDHKDAIDKTEYFTKLNKDMERKVEQLNSQMQENDLAKSQIQESFSQKYYILHKKIDKLREEYKQSEMELDHKVRGQIQERNDELQRILNNTHAMLIENSGLVDQLNETVVKRASGAVGEVGSKRINFMKEEGRRDAQENYEKLLSNQAKEFESQLQSTQNTYENLLKKKEEELEKAGRDFKAFHDKTKSDQNQARLEIVRLYGIAKKQNQILSNVESGVYSQTAKRISFNQDQKPLMPEPHRFKFLFSAIDKVGSQRGTTSNYQTVQSGKFTLGEKAAANANHILISQPDTSSEFLNRKVDQVTNPEELRKYVRDLMNELGKHSSSHPKILKGENVDSVLKEIEFHKKEYEKASKAHNDLKIQIEAQKRLIERIQMEQFMVPGQPNLNR